jgi:thiol-disulfide isomerase/thioredoxin
MRWAAVTVLSALLLLGGQAQASPRDIVGKAAPDFKGKLVSGEPFALSRYLGKGPVILTFWSIYCKSCVDEMSALERLARKYGAGKLNLVAVNEDGDVGIGRVRNFMERFLSTGEGARFSFPLFFDERGDVFSRYQVVHLPTLIYIDGAGIVREVIEGFEQGKELAVLSAIEKLLGSVSPEPLKEVAAEAVYDLEVAAPLCGVYRDGKWYRPLDRDEAGRPEAIARGRAGGEEHLRREAVRLALAEMGIELYATDHTPSCAVPYGMEVRSAFWRKDPLDLFIDKLNLPRVLEVVSQETVEREREVLLFRRTKLQLNALREQLAADGYTAARSEVRLRFVRATPLEQRAFLEAVSTQFPYLSGIRKAVIPKGGTEYVLSCHAPLDKVMEKLRGLDVGPPKLSLDLLTGGIVEVAMWR